MTAASSIPFTEGYVPYKVEGETLQTYYKLSGTLTNTSKRPLIVLHGGPGLSHDYLLPLMDLSLAPYSHPVLFYDQIGNARSTHLRGKPTQYFTIDLFVNELVNLISFLNITEFDLIGHSWGGMLAAEFEVGLHPRGLKSMVITNSLSATQLWDISTLQLASALGDDVKQGIETGFNNPIRFRNALEQLYASNGCTVSPVPTEITFSVFDVIFGDKETGQRGDPTVPLNMFSGALSNWSIDERLHEVSVPTFVINGRKDIAQDFVCKAYFVEVGQSQWMTFENSSHVPMWEEREKYMEVLNEWLEKDGL